jgi:hypothetical protein
VLPRCFDAGSGRPNEADLPFPPEKWTNLNRGLKTKIYSLNLYISKKFANIGTLLTMSWINH